MATDAPALICREVTVAYGDVAVLDGLDLEVGPGETVGLLGPSGSGKTTLLYAVAGFVEPSRGEIEIAGTPVHTARRSMPTEDRDVGLVFQNYALWPHLTAGENVAYPLRRRRIGARQARDRAAELLDLMGIGGLDRRRPDQLSGGQQQRVGLARALAREARLYLLDEPTAHLDAPLRAALQGEIAALRERTGAAALYATHDAGEALAVSDRVALLREGRLVQIGTPTEVYSQPVDLWAAELTGPASVLDVAVVAADVGSMTVSVGDVRIEVDVAVQTSAPSGAARLLVRPDWVRLGGDGAVGDVDHVAFRGPHTDYRLTTPVGRLVARAGGPPCHAQGDRVSWTIERAWTLSSDGSHPDAGGGEAGDRVE